MAFKEHSYVSDLNNVIVEQKNRIRELEGQNFKLQKEIDLFKNIAKSGREIKRNMSSVKSGCVFRKEHR
jgi:hypothetical protein